MNSAVETLLKAINDLSTRVSTLEAEKWELIRRIWNLEAGMSNTQIRVGQLEDSAPAANRINTSTYIPGTAYWNTITDGVRIWASSYVSDFNANNDWTFTLTYSDGRTVTIGN